MDTEKIKCKGVQVGDWISPENTKRCNHKVHKIEEGHKILFFLPARRLHMGNDINVLWIRNYGPGKPMRRKLK